MVRLISVYQMSRQCYLCDSTKPGGQGDVKDPTECGSYTTCQTDEVKLVVALSDLTQAMTVGVKHCLKGAHLLPDGKSFIAFTSMRVIRKF